MLFMVEGQLAVAPTPEILALIPQESARGRELEAQGLRLHVFVAADQSGAWQVFEVDSREQLDELLASFPLQPYVTEKVTQLAEPADA